MAYVKIIFKKDSLLTEAKNVSFDFMIDLLKQLFRSFRFYIMFLTMVNPLEK